MCSHPEDGAKYDNKEQRPINHKTGTSLRWWPVYRKMWPEYVNYIEN